MNTYTDEEKEYAALIHALTCNHNHTDCCAWFYGEEHRTFEYETARKQLPRFKSGGGNLQSLHLIVNTIYPNKKWV